MTVGTLPASCRGNINAALNCSAAGQAGRTAGGTFNPPTGVCQMTSFAGASVDFAIGEQVTFGGLFIVTA